MGGSGDEGGAATPPTVQPRGASRAALLEQRKSEVQDAAVVGSLVKVVYAEAWTTRAGGAAMSSGYGKQVPKKKLPHIGGGDKPDGFDPTACQTYRDVDQFLAEPDEGKFFDAIKAYVATFVVSCMARSSSSSS